MTFETVVRAEDAAAHVGDRRWVFVDCRFTLSNPGQGEEEYRRSHLPGAVYAHLDRDLSGPVAAGVTGRHPLPAVDALERALQRLGIDGSSQVVAYDASTGAMAAARLWWLLKWAGHDAVAVLDGGLSRWTALGLPRAEGPEVRPRAGFEAKVRARLVSDAAQVTSIRQDPAWALLDVRSADRFEGRNETMDPVAGHIPGARSAPYLESLREDGSFRDPVELARRFDSLGAGGEAARTVFYCGSGVTAAHGVLALAHAGKGMARLYAGSWSEWITDPRRPIATE
jgi:thiosulfate/3-mercaptopyruvate sulfurtransferase